MQDKKSARLVVADYVSRRERTEAELKRKLEEKGYSEDEMDDAMGYARDCGLVDDRSYCVRFAEYSLKKERGPLRVMRDLSEKGVKRERIQDALTEVMDEEAERETALHLAEKELPEEAGEKEFARVARKLASRGFRGSVISWVMNRLR